jgi:mono/diheme cytochrome c family protein
MGGVRAGILIGVAVAAVVAVAQAQPAPTASTAAQSQAAPSAPTAPEYTAIAANCVACHSVPGGRAFVGGLKMMTPLGAIYSTNITPDPDTGIGDYTLEDFDRAVRGGIAKDGHHLYPAMPYPSYAKLSADDVKALYDYFMKSVPAAKQSSPPSEIPWPLNMRWPLAIWNALFVDDKPYVQKPEHDAAWNRGAYLVQGLGHCGACHTPRGIAFNEKALDESHGDYLAGAPLDNWSAPNLTQAPLTGLGRWSVADIAAFLKTGHNSAGTAFGTMIEVINNSTQYLSDADLTAIATYLKWLPTAGGAQKAYAYDSSTAVQLRAGQKAGPGGVVYVQRCQACHGADGKGYAPYLPPLAGNPAVLDPDPASAINISLNGSARVVVNGLPDAYRMPQFRVTLSDQQIADVVSFIRHGWGNGASAVTASDVAHVRAETNPASDRVEALRMK